MKDRTPAVYVDGKRVEEPPKSTGAPAVTYKECCEAIAEVHNACRAAGIESMLGPKTPDIVTGEDVWNYSPTGELFMISIWYLAVPLYREALTEAQR